MPQKRHCTTYADPENPDSSDWQRNLHSLFELIVEPSRHPEARPIVIFIDAMNEATSYDGALLTTKSQGFLEHFASLLHPAQSSGKYFLTLLILIALENVSRSFFSKVNLS